MESATDTIAAIATGSGKAGIGVVRISGSLVETIATGITAKALMPRHAHHLPFLDEHGQVVDEGIAMRFVAPHSFTGEDVLELQGHGGPVILDLLLQRVLQLGARVAKPGEFSERAFHNDKLDLAQAEAISDLIESSSVAAAKAAVRSMRGEFSAHIELINTELVALRVWLEAAMDFSEEEIDFLAEPQLQQRAVNLIDQFELLLARAEQGQRLRDGFNVVIAGSTNAGKSSLLNRLAGDDTAIVTNIAGTTRDVLQTDITLQGVPIHITDTAGIRHTEDVVELEGIRRATKAIASADHVMIILDALTPVMPELPELNAQQVSVVLNKSDLVDRSTLDTLQQQFKSTLHVSAKTGSNMDALADHILKLAGHDQQIEGVYLSRRRHIDAIEVALLSTREAFERLKVNTMPELAAEELRHAQQALEIITGRFDTEDLLGEIFSNFCVGK